MKIKPLTFVTTAIAVIYISCTTPEEPQAVVVVNNTPTVAKYSIDKTPIWQDEFDYEGLPDPKKWDYDIGGSGWGNQEKQFYTKEKKNARVENGKLIIEAHKEKYDNNNYTSARLVTKGKGDFLYGRFEFKAKLPKGIGTWPAAWMLATNQVYGSQYWPDNGEIDVIEHVGFDQDRIHGNIHTKAFNHSIGTNKGNSMVLKGVSDEFHVYACEWYPDKITIELDGKTYFTFSNSNNGWQEWPFDKNFYLILNIAVGGSWGGQKGIDDNIFPQRMEVDYVRVYPLKKE